MLLNEIFLIEERGGVLFHGFKDAKYAQRALEYNEMLGTTTQRWWPDGRRRKENAPDYKSSYWMKGISLTRDFEFASKWGMVVFELDQAALVHNFKMVPFAWNYHFDPKLNPNPDHKKEREEFLILDKSPNDYQPIDPDTGEKRLDYDAYNAPAPKRLAPLNRYLRGIYLDMDMGEYSHLEPIAQEIIKHPLFKGWYNHSGKRYASKAPKRVSDDERENAATHFADLRYGRKGTTPPSTL